MATIFLKKGCGGSGKLYGQLINLLVDPKSVQNLRANVNTMINLGVSKIWLMKPTQGHVALVAVGGSLHKGVAHNILMTFICL